jgi:hypothetical protein
MTKPRSDKITRAEMKTALLRSGYLLESRVESLLREHWGYVEANCTYPDPETGKSREFDLYGISGRKVGPDDGDDWLFGVLLIECVNNPQPLAILTKEPMVGFLHHQEIKMAGLPIKIPAKEGSGSQRMSEFLGMSDFHHYCKGRVGTQYCSFARKKGGDEEWMAMHEGSHFDSFRKLCDMTDYYIDKHFKHWSFDGTKESLNIEIYYPIIVVQGDLVEARESGRSVTFQYADHIQFRQSVARRGKVGSYQMDIVRERYLPKYLGQIDDELAKTAALLRNHQETTRRAINSIVERAKGITSPEHQREIMDFEDKGA